MNVAMDRIKEVVRLGSAETKGVEPVLPATKLSKQYGSATVLAEVTLDILPGEFHAIIGENGWRGIGIVYYGGGLGDGIGTV